MPKCSFLILVLFAGVLACPAQMTIFNVPSTDVLPKKGAYIEADFSAKPAKLKNDGFQTYGWRVVYGVGARTELGANVYFTRDADGWTRELQVSAKTTLLAPKESGFAWTIGALGSTPVHDDRGNKRYAFLYSNASQVINTEYRGFGLHQPVLHRMTPASVTTASSGTSCHSRPIDGTCWNE